MLQCWCPSKSFEKQQTKMARSLSGLPQMHIIPAGRTPGCFASPVGLYPMGSCLRLLHRVGRNFRLHILHSCLDSIFCQHATVKLDGGQAQMLGNVTVLDGQNFFEGLSLDPFRGHAAGSNGRPTSERFESRIQDVSVLVHFDLQLHHVSARRSTDQCRTHEWIVLVEGTDIPGIFVVLHHLQATVTSTFRVPRRRQLSFRSVYGSHRFRTLPARTFLW
mmetsp:Transcript_10604/g.65403  ORF Transcript_10604/g.65403 Transcript_10604/m.65403 type:complete len:219 (-) Transcript_10604:8-664(-)